MCATDEAAKVAKALKAAEQEMCAWGKFIVNFQAATASFGKSIEKFKDFKQLGAGQNSKGREGNELQNNIQK